MVTENLEAQKESKSGKVLNFFGKPDPYKDFSKKSQAG